ncbi:MAG: hypothetical protein LUG27_10900 [Clostridiales bacterium]|nr:hypothetical protein [Clostridiales bacterium]
MIEEMAQKLESMNKNADGTAEVLDGKEAVGELNEYKKRTAVSAQVNGRADSVYAGAAGQGTGGFGNR